MTISSEQRRFDEALKQVLSVSKEELLQREKAYQAARAGKSKPGPKPKRRSASCHASSAKD